MTTRAKSDKPEVPAAERCEAISYAGPYLRHHCDRRGVMCSVTGSLSTGFSRLCKLHQTMFAKQGLTIQVLSPIENQAAGAVGL